MQIKREEYRSHPAVNASYLKRVLSHSVWHADVPMTPTPQMEFGTAAHTLILEPESFSQEYELFMGDRRTKAGKLAYQTIVDEGKKAISESDVARLQAMSNNVQAHMETADLLMNAEAVELSLLFESPYFAGIECKAQIDLYTKDGILVDLKTISDIERAEKQFFSLHYDLQLAYYRDALQQCGHQVNAVKVMFVETAAPHQVALYDIPNQVLANGTDKIRIATRKWMQQKDQAQPELIRREILMPEWAVMLDEEASPF